jgi:hypothetical protein
MSEGIVNYYTGTDVSVVEKANALAIYNLADYEAAGKFKQELKTMYKQRFDAFEEERLKKKAEYDLVLSERKSICEPYEKAIEIVQRHLDDYLTKIENERREAQRKAEAEARAQAERKRQALLERAAKAKTTQKQEALLEEAELVYEQPVIAAPVQPKTVRTDSGVVLTGKRVIEVDVIDLRKLCKAIGDDIAPDTIVDINYSMLKKWVQGAGIKNGQIPGIIIKETTKASGR